MYKRQYKDGKTNGGINQMSYHYGGQSQIK